MPKRPTKDERDATELARQELEQFKDLILHNKDINVHHFLNKGEYSKTHKSKSKQKSLDMIPDLTDIESISRFLMNPADEVTVMQEQAMMIATLQKKKDIKNIPSPKEIWYNIRINILEKELENKFNRRFSVFWDDPEDLTEEERNEVKKIWRGFDEGRTLLFERSNYGKMYRELQTMPSLLSEQVEKLSENDPAAIAGLEHTEHQALAYYFAMHTELDPLAAYNLTQTQHDEIIDLYSRLDKFMAKRLKSVSNLSAIEIAFFAFINKNDRELRKKQGLPAFNPKLPDFYVMPNTLVVNELHNKISEILRDKEQGKEHSGKLVNWDIKKYNPKTKKAEKENIEVYVDVNVNKAVSNLSPFEREIYNSVCSVWEGDKNRLCTPQTLYRVMTQKKKGEYVSPAQVEEMKAIIDRMRTTLTEIDATKEAAAYGYNFSDNDSLILKENLLNIQEVKARVGNTVIDVYKIISEPILLKYSKLSKQIITLPAKLLEIKETTRTANKDTTEINRNTIKLSDKAAPIANSENRIVIKSYLLRAIAIMENHRSKRSTTILVNTLMEACNLNDRKRYKHIEYIQQCLDYWTATGHIKGYTMNREGKSIKSFTIKLNPDKEKEPTKDTKKT